MPQQRECGSCTACCKTHPNEAFAKPAGVWCVNCVIGKGCGVYSSRPQECKDYICAWRAGYFNENERPDKVHVIVDYGGLMPRGQFVARIYEVSEGALRGRFAQEVTKFCLQDDMGVLLVALNQRLELLMPPDTFLTPEERNHITTAAEEEVVFRRTWRKFA